MKRLWRWFKSHFTNLDDDPETVKSKQADKTGVIVGFRFWF